MMDFTEGRTLRRVLALGISKVAHLTAESLLDPTAAKTPNP